MNFFESYTEDTLALQLNTEYLNLYLVNKVQLYPTKEYESSHFYSAQLNININSICAIRSSTAYVRGYMYGDKYIVQSLDQQPVTVYVFEAREASNTGNFGLVLYDENGKAIFNSNDKPLRVIDSIYKEIETSYSDRELVNKSYNKEIAVVCSMSSTTVTYDPLEIEGGFYIPTYNYGTIKVSNSNKTLQLNNTRKFGDRTTAVYSDFEGSAPFEVLIVDVTNY